MGGSTAFVVLEDGALGLWSKVDGYQGIVTTTVTVTVQPRPQTILQPIGALEDGEQPLACCGITAVPHYLVHVNRPILAASW